MTLIRRIGAAALMLSLVVVLGACGGGRPPAGTYVDLSREPDVPYKFPEIPGVPGSRVCGYLKAGKRTASDIEGFDLSCAQVAPVVARILRTGRAPAGWSARLDRRDTGINGLQPGHHIIGRVEASRTRPGKPAGIRFIVGGGHRAPPPFIDLEDGDSHALR